MNTITLPRNRIFKNTGHAIGQNTQNIAFNLPDRAAQILDEVAGENRSNFIRWSLAIGIRLKNTGKGLAFEAAAKIRKAISIFSPGTPEDKAAACQAELETAIPELKNPHPTGGAHLIDDLLKPAPSGEFEPKR